MEIAVVSLVLCTRWMSSGGAKPLTSTTWFSLLILSESVQVNEGWVDR
jgi:hypothetical protein